MKKTKGQVLCIMGEAILMFVVPALLLWLNYGDNAFIAVKYKVSITGMLFVLLFFMLSKRFWLDGELQKMRTKIANIETNALSVTEAEAIATMKKTYCQMLYLDNIVKAIVPLIILVGVCIIVKALEEQALKLYAVFLWSTIAFFGGVALKFVEVALTKFPHEG